MLSQDEDVKVETSRSFLPSTKPTYKLTPAEMLKKRIKRDASLFSNFKDRRFQDNWCRITIDASYEQDIADMLDPNYSPTSPKCAVLFNEKQNSRCYVFDEVLENTYSV